MTGRPGLPGYKLGSEARGCWVRAVFSVTIVTPRAGGKSSERRRPGLGPTGRYVRVRGSAAGRSVRGGAGLGPWAKPRRAGGPGSPLTRGPAPPPPPRGSDSSPRCPVPPPPGPGLPSPPPGGPGSPFPPSSLYPVSALFLYDVSFYTAFFPTASASEVATEAVPARVHSPLSRGGAPCGVTSFSLFLAGGSFDLMILWRTQ